MARKAAGAEHRSLRRHKARALTCWHPPVIVGTKCRNVRESIIKGRRRLQHDGFHGGMGQTTLRAARRAVVPLFFCPGTLFFFFWAIANLFFLSPSSQFVFVAIAIFIYFFLASAIFFFTPHQFHPPVSAPTHRRSEPAALVDETHRDLPPHLHSWRKWHHAPPWQTTQGQDRAPAGCAER